MSVEFTITFCTWFSRIDRFQFAGETYDEYTAFCLKSGQFSYHIGQGEEQCLSAGELVICPPGQLFARRIVQPVALLMIKFIAPPPDLPLGCTLRPTDTLRFDENIRRLETCIFCADMQRYPRFVHHARDILYLALDTARDTSLISPALTELQARFAEPITIAALAAKAGYSTAHFINLFKKQHGITPAQYVVRLRLQKAKQSLLMTDLTSKEIAFSCGFRDELYFIRFFKTHTGLTPTQFRRINNT